MIKVITPTNRSYYYNTAVKQDLAQLLSSIGGVWDSQDTAYIGKIDKQFKKIVSVKRFTKMIITDKWLEEFITTISTTNQIIFNDYKFIKD